MLRRLIPLCALATLALGTGGCATAPDQPARLTTVIELLPPMKRFAATSPPPPQRPNAEMAQDFLELTFRMESGRTVPVFTRFEGPITLALAGPVPATAPGDADALVARLKREARIDIRRIADPAEARIVIEFVPAARLRGAVPKAACFVVPNVGSLSEYLRARRSEKVDWARLETRERATVFIPADTSPQEIRDCLHEEVAQALGPLNDLYRLSDSTFNDDNFHAVLTGFDMLMLRATYDPALASGLSEAEVAGRIGPILDRLNPAGRGGTAAPPSPTPRDWIAATETAIGPSATETARRNAAARALAIAQAEGWADARAAFSHFNYARAMMPVDPEAGVVNLLAARHLYDRLPGTRIHAAHADMQFVAMALAGGEPEEALALLDKRIPDARAAENAALLATFLMMRAEALARLGRGAEAEAARLDSLGWARYGFGQDELVRARAAEVAGLGPAAGHGSEEDRG